MILSLSLTALVAVSSAQTATLSTFSTAPTDGSINIDISTPDDSVSAITSRYLSAGNQRSLIQTYVWNTDSDMSGLALRVAQTQNGTSGQYFTNGSQNYALDIQLLVSATGDRTVQNTLMTYFFTIKKSMIKADNFLYIEFDTPLELVSGAAYGFNFRPMEENIVNAIAIAQSFSDYANGVANQSASASIFSTGSPYGNAGFDLAFYTTASPVPSNIAGTCCE